MADLAQSRAGTINSADNYVLPYAGDYGGALTIEVNPAAFTGTGIVVKGRAKGSALPWLPIPYTKKHLNGVVGDDTVASVVLTAASLIQIQVSDGVEVSLDASAGGWSGGSMAFYATPVPTRG